MEAYCVICLPTRQASQEVYASRLVTLTATDAPTSFRAPGGGPHVKVLSGVNDSELRSFLRYDPAVQSGVFVTAVAIPADPPPAASNGDLKVSLISLSTETPAVDRDFSYSVRVQNLGPGSAADTILKLELPTNSTLRGEIPGCAPRPYRVETSFAI